MTMIAIGGAAASLDSGDLRAALQAMFSRLGRRDRILVLPPDATRRDSRAGELTVLAHEICGDRVTDIMPALGTHWPMKPDQLDAMFPGVPHELFRVHDWRNDVVTLGEVPASFVSEATGGMYRRPWKAQVNTMLRDGGHDLILSIGQVVPHEVIGMANYNKNVFIGTGGVEGINESHYLSAVFGIEQTLGVADTPLRRILNHASDQFCGEMPIVYVLTVIEQTADGTLHTRGLFIGDDHETFFAAAELAREVNITHLTQRPKHVVAFLDPAEFQSTWLGNKAVYRTRKAIADGGRLTVIGPGVREFGEDPAIDALIRKFGYRSRRDVIELVATQPDLAGNLSAAAHLVHGCPEGRFDVFYGAGRLSQREIESVHFQYADCDALLSRYDVNALSDGWHIDTDGTEFYFIRNPALGLWEPAAET